MQKADAILVIFIMGCLLLGWGDNIGAKGIGFLVLFTTVVMLILGGENGKG